MDPYADDNQPPLVDIVKELLLVPVRILTSKRAQRTYLNAILLALAALFLYLISVGNYILLYKTYIPNLSFTLPIHLQFDHLQHSAPLDPYIYHPHGQAPFSASDTPSTALATYQPYDISISIAMPRNPVNIAAGNFMLSLELLGPAPTPSSRDANFNSTAAAADAPVLVRSSRPASLTYTSPALDYAIKAATFPLYLVGWKRESESLDVRMMEGVSFERGARNVPRTARVELWSRERLQVYGCGVKVHARLQGIRSFMYNYRIIAFLLFTSLAWTVSVAFCVAVWLAASYLFFPARPQPSTAALSRPKQSGLVSMSDEDEDEPFLSDTSRNFPTYSRQPPLRYTGSASARQGIKQEDEGLAGAAAAIVQGGAGGEADAEDEGDEDEDADFVLDNGAAAGGAGRAFDSGIGTSLESGEGEALRRRRSGKGSSGGASSAAVKKEEEEE